MINIRDWMLSILDKSTTTNLAFRFLLTSLLTLALWKYSSNYYPLRISNDLYFFIIFLASFGIANIIVNLATFLITKCCKIIKTIKIKIAIRKNLDSLFEIIDDLSSEERDFLYSFIEKHQIVHEPPYNYECFKREGYIYVKKYMNSGDVIYDMPAYLKKRLKRHFKSIKSKK
ncbi:hypothetical protein [Legionella pneumophila]